MKLILDQSALRVATDIVPAGVEGSDGVLKSHFRASRQAGGL